MIKNVKYALLLSLGLIILPTETVYAAQETNTAIQDDNINRNYRATKSFINTDNMFPVIATISNDTVEKSINTILTDRINICKVNTEVSDTVDSISLTADVLLEEKEKQEEQKRLEAERILKQQQADEERKQKIEEAKKDDLYMLAAIIHCEARGESYEGQVAVGAVVLNRVNNDNFPGNIKDVIYQSGQFSPVGSGTFDSVLLSGKINSSCYEAASAALNGENPVGDCLYFRRVNGTEGQIIGNHVFY